MPQELQAVPIRSSLTRPRLIAGAERELFLFLLLICTSLVFVLMSLPAAIAGVIIWSGGYWALREMAKGDPMMSKIFFRHIRYRPFYRARSSRTVIDQKKGKKKQCYS